MRFGVLAALEENDAVGGLVVDDDGGNEQGHRFERGLESFGLVVGCPLSHGWCPFVGRLVGSLGQRFACAAGKFGGSGYFAALVDGQGGAE